MRYMLIAVLVAALALPAVAATPQYGLMYNLTFNSDGTISGTFGGIPVSGTWNGGNWTLSIDGKTFATGTYTCNGTCTFTGATLMGKSASFTFSSGTLVGAKSGQLAGVFSNHGGWVSSVTKWAAANLTTVRRGQIVSAAAHNNRLWMQANHTGNGGQSAEKKSDHAGGNGKGKGPKN